MNSTPQPIPSTMYHGVLLPEEEIHCLKEIELIIRHPIPFVDENPMAPYSEMRFKPRTFRYPREKRPPAILRTARRGGEKKEKGGELSCQKATLSGRGGHI